MNSLLATERYSFDRPAVYQIRLQGRLRQACPDFMAAVTIIVTGEATVLRGELADQAALCGLLNHLYDMQLTLLSVVRLEDAHGSR